MYDTWVRTPTADGCACLRCVCFACDTLRMLISPLKDKRAYKLLRTCICCFVVASRQVCANTSHIAETEGANSVSRASCS